MSQINTSTGCTVYAFTGTTVAGTDRGLSGSNGLLDWLVGHGPGNQFRVPNPLFRVPDQLPHGPGIWYNQYY